MKILIKNMVCNRCVLIVESILAKLDISNSFVELGSVTFKKTILNEKFETFQKELALTGLEVVDEKRQQIQEQIKLKCQQFLNDQLFYQNTNLSAYLSEQLHKDYSHLSRLFSSIESVSIEQYYLALRIEKVKELISYQQSSFSEIAYDVGYSSTAHMSKQFKKLTGLTPSDFKKNLAHVKRSSLDNLKIV